MTLRRILLIVVSVAIFIIANLPPGLVPAGPSNDKLNHFVAFFAISCAAIYAFPQSPLTHIFLGLIAFNVMIEASQAWFSVGRQPELLDFGAGALATVIVTLGHAIWRARSPDSSKP